MLLTSNVKTLMYFNYYTLLSAYVQIQINSQCLGSALYSTNIYTQESNLGHGLYML